MKHSVFAELAVKMTEQSPQWKKPSDVMIMRKRKKPSAYGSQSTTATVLGASSSEGPARQLRKRSNPFVCSPVKRRSSRKLTLDAQNGKTETGACDVKPNEFLDILAEAEESEVRQG